jgi:hypothetical protein
MVTLTNEIKESLAATKLAFFATSAKDRTPNVVPIAAFRILDDGTLLISDQFFNKTLANMKENPKAAISWWGEKGGFQIKGTVTIHTDGEIWRQDLAWMKELRPSLKPTSSTRSGWAKPRRSSSTSSRYSFNRWRK